MKLIILLIGILSSITHADERLINGTPVAAGAYKEVVRIKTGNSGCTASIIGPRVLLTAAHCASNNSNSVFSVDNIDYSAAMQRSTLYPNKDHDMALGLIDKDVPGIKFASIWDTKPTIGDTMHFLGYGCTEPGGSGGNDGILREGDAQVTGFSNYDIVSRGGAALCYGDSGGPAYFVSKRGVKQQISVNSKGNIKDTNYTTDLTSNESQKFLKDFAVQHGVEICGVTKDCTDNENEFVVENDYARMHVTDKEKHEQGYVKRYVEMLMLFLEGEGDGEIFKRRIRVGETMH
jgi:hypothetical protein